MIKQLQEVNPFLNYYKDDENVKLFNTHIQTLLDIKNSQTPITDNYIDSVLETITQLSEVELPYIKVKLDKLVADTMCVSIYALEERVTTVILPTRKVVQCILEVTRKDNTALSDILNQHLVNTSVTEILSKKYLAIVKGKPFTYRIPTREDINKLIDDVLALVHSIFLYKDLSNQFNRLVKRIGNRDIEKATKEAKSVINNLTHINPIDKKKIFELLDNNLSKCNVTNTTVMLNNRKTDLTTFLDLLKNHTGVVSLDGHPNTIHIIKTSNGIEANVSLVDPYNHVPKSFTLIKTFSYFPEMPTEELIRLYYEILEEVNK